MNLWITRGVLASGWALTACGVALAVWTGVRPPADAPAQAEAVAPSAQAAAPGDTAGEPTEAADPNPTKPQDDDATATAATKPDPSTPLAAGAATDGDADGAKADGAKADSAKADSAKADGDGDAIEFEIDEAKPSDAAPPQGASADDAGSGAKVLLIGDSQVMGFFGRSMDYLMRRVWTKADVTTFAVCASNPKSWTTKQRHLCGWLKREPGHVADAKFKHKRLTHGTDNSGVTYPGRIHTPVLLELLQERQTNTLLIGLGENAKEASYSFIRDNTKAMMRQIDCYRAGLSTVEACDAATEDALKAARSAPKRPLQCVWIMSPWTDYAHTTQRLERYIQAFTEGIGESCHALDSRPLTCRMGLKGKTKICKPDRAGVHFSMRRARVWAFGAFDATAKLLNLPTMDKATREELDKDWRLNLIEAKPAAKATGKP